jgi:hypothetical protein
MATLKIQLKYMQNLLVLDWVGRLAGWLADWIGWLSLGPNGLFQHQAKPSSLF